MMNKHTIEYNGQIIEFELYRKDVKNINLNTRPDLTVMVSAHEQVPLDYIKDYVKAKAPWILKNLSQFQDTQTEEYRRKEYVSGESFKYLGRQLRLKIQESPDEDVKYLRGHLFLSVKNKDNFKAKQNLLNTWFRERARIVFAESLNRIYPLAEKYEIKPPNIMIRTMKARWGSCVLDKGLIILNFELIKAPKYCIDYVVLHELLHFKYKNHDRNFYDLMTVLMPDWKARKQILDEEVVRNL